MYISFSGGKDSTVLLHLVRSIFPNVIAVFSNTTNEYPEILKYVKSFDNVTWVHPKKTFKDIIKDDGFPLISKAQSRALKDLQNPTERNKLSREIWITGYSQTGKYHANKKLSEKWKFLIDSDIKLTDNCCNILKKEPFKRFEKETRLKPFVGTLADEGSQRQDNYIRFGCNIFTQGSEKSRPLSIWTEQDIWDYAKINDIRFCELYYDSYSKDGKFIQAEDRTGCMVCGFGYHLEKSDLFNQDRFDRLKLRRPKLYEKYMNLTNNGVTFREALSVVKNAKS